MQAVRLVPLMIAFLYIFVKNHYNQVGFHGISLNVYADLKFFNLPPPTRFFRRLRIQHYIRHIVTVCGVKACAGKTVLSITYDSKCYAAFSIIHVYFSALLNFTIS